MSRPLQDEPFEALERRLAGAKMDRDQLTAILHELSFRDGPRETALKERAEEAWIEQVIAQAKSDPMARAKPAAHAAAHRKGAATGSLHDDVPDFDPGPMLSEMTTFNAALKTEESWHGAKRHRVVLAVSVIGIVALASAHLAGAFHSKRGVAVQVYPEPQSAREVAQLPYIPMGVSGEGKAGDIKPPGTGGIAVPAPPAGTALAGAGPQPNPPGAARPVSRLNLTTDLANMYAGEGPQIARAAVAAAGLGLNETVRWRNEKSGRHGSVTLIAQNPQRTNCYTARITRLDTKMPQRRTQQLCFKIGLPRPI